MGAALLEKEECGRYDKKRELLKSLWLRPAAETGVGPKICLWMRKAKLPESHATPMFATV
jgi:hypothetical protein